jgi:Flp pilus assembly protein TadB
MELEHWKIIEEKRIPEAHLIEETALKMVEWEKEKSRAANEAAEAAQMRVEIEVQKRIKAEKKVLKETEEKKKVLDALGQSHIVVKHQSLFHMIVVVLLFYFYFSVFK